MSEVILETEAILQELFANAADLPAQPEGDVVEHPGSLTYLKLTHRNGIHIDVVLARQTCLVNSGYFLNKRNAKRRYYTTVFASTRFLIPKKRHLPCRVVHIRAVT